MLLTYMKPSGDAPRIERLKPNLPDGNQQLAKLKRPPALPSHCKPWLDAAAHGYVLRYPYQSAIAVQGRAGKLPAVESEPGLATRRTLVVTSFAPRHFSLLTGYRLRTPQGIGILTTPAPDSDPTTRLVEGLLETWWYPRPLFLVFENPLPGQTITFAPDQVLSVLRPVLCESLEAKEMSSSEEEELLSADAEYLERQHQNPDLAWTSVEGFGFSHLYRVVSKSNRRRPRSSAFPDET